MKKPGKLTGCFGKSPFLTGIFKVYHHKWAMSSN